MSHWYYKHENEIRGPFSLQHMQNLISQGEISADDLVRKGTKGEFTPACEIPQLIIKTENQLYQFPHKKKSHPLLILGIICIFLFITIQIAIQIYPFRTSGRPRSATRNNLKQIGLALHNYHEQHGTFPPGAIISVSGKPYHSWLTLILPFLEQSALHQKVDFNKPWNDPFNQKLFRQEVSFFLKPSITDKYSPKGYALSHYVGNELVLKQNKGIRLQDIKDGASNTIVAVEIGEQFKPWGDPANIANPVNIIGVGKKSPATGGNHVLLSDGSVRFFSEDVDPAILKALSTPGGGEIVGDF
ncbi:MAG: DUF1559 domain-containing protein [Planctomycetes bacterium]|nr:DUF1559 domain-containing protein [Planctomycetota bacterium]MCH9778140.1 DUF1559 domain-containing protein [Planctomycetota bacterium]